MPVVANPKKRGANQIDDPEKQKRPKKQTPNVAKMSTGSAQGSSSTVNLPTSLAGIFKPSSSKQKPTSAVASTTKQDAIAKTDDEDADEDSDTSEDDTVTIAKYGPLVNRLEAKRKVNVQGGRPHVKILDTLLQPAHRLHAPEKLLHRCRGQDCQRTFVNRGVTRTIRHAVACFKLTRELRMVAREHAAAGAGSRKVAALELAVEGKERVQDDGEGKKLVEGQGKVTVLYERAKINGRKARHAVLDLAIVKLICAAGLPTSLVGRPEWADVFSAADPSYLPAKRDKLEYEQIVEEAEHVYLTQLDYLKTEENLTVSVDGGTSKGREAFWTLHISTEARKVYFMEGREATSESHTGVWIADFVFDVSCQWGSL